MASLADLSRRLNLTCRRTIRGQRPPPVVLMTDQARLPDPLPIAAGLPVGSLVILRHYDDPHRQELGRALARLCRAKRLRLLVAGDFKLAQSLKAGLHLPDYRLDLPVPAIRLWRRLKPGYLSAACHSAQALRRAEALRVQTALLSPVFATASHPGAKSLGLRQFRRLVGQSSLPVYALGGVNRRTILALRGSGAAGVAAIGGFL
jgi:thiamine-phosphate pyrophosphorylase